MLTKKIAQLSQSKSSSCSSENLRRKSLTISESEEGEAVDQTRTLEYLNRFNLPFTEKLVTSFKCNYTENVVRLGKAYVFTHYLCFWPQILKSNYNVFKFDDIASIKFSTHKRFSIILTSGTKIKFTRISEYLL